MGRRLREGLPISIKSRSRPGCVFGAGIPGSSPLFQSSEGVSRGFKVENG